MKARIVDGIVYEILIPVPGHSLEECFHPDLLAQCVDVGDLKVGDKYPPESTLPVE